MWPEAAIQVSLVVVIAAIGILPATAFFLTLFFSRNMFDEKRRMTSIVYLSCLAATLLLIFIPLPGTLKLIVLMLLMIAQFGASLWYTLSYIPYGRKTFLRTVQKIAGVEERSDYAGIQLA